MNPDKQNYLAPRLESPPNYRGTTGVSLPIGTSTFTDPLETDFLTHMDFMEGEQ